MSDNKYQRGKIYRLVCNTTGLQYYGSKNYVIDLQNTNHVINCI